MPRIECKYMETGDCDEVVMGDDVFRTFVAYIKHLETMHPELTEQWLKKRNLPEFYRAIDRWLER